MLGEEDEKPKEDENLNGRKVYSRRSSKRPDDSLGVENSVKKLQKSGLDLDLGQGNKVRISLLMKSKHDAMELRRKLESEREMVRSLMRKIETNELEHRQAAAADPPRFGDKEKRTPKENSLYRNSDFVPGKGRVPATETNMKLNGVETASKQAFKRCEAILQRLRRHKHGHLFNQPVDPVALGLPDYFDVIKNPMDFGTVKDKLANGLYMSITEFAKDIRLTFRNAMRYNPKGTFVHNIAEQLSGMFEKKWAQIEASFKHEVPEKVEVGFPKPPSRAPLASSIRKIGKAASSGKIPVPNKPRAKHPNKREMAYDEKQKLSMNLQSLPAEKLENVVQIIRKRNPSVSQQDDDEIEVDIDAVDTETLWELARFFTNYKKSLSKNKRKAEFTTEKNLENEIVSAVLPEFQKDSLTSKEKGALPLVDTAQDGIRSDGGSESGSSSNDSDGGHSAKQ